MNKKIYLVAAVGVFFVSAVVCGTTLAMISQQHPQEVEKIHIHAGFVVYEQGKQLDFGRPEFMHIGACHASSSTVETDPKAEQLEKAHLHSLIGDVVHVHRKGATWDDLFQNLRFTIGLDTSRLKVIINGKEVKDGSHQEIATYDIAEFLINTDAIYVTNSTLLTKTYIESIEHGAAESCGLE